MGSISPTSHFHREYSGFPGCSGRGDSGALSGVMATITSIVLIIHIGKNEMPGSTCTCLLGINIKR